MKPVLKAGSVLSLIALLSACASSGSNTSSGVQYDPKAAERARPFLVDHTGADITSISTRDIGSTCENPNPAADWKSWVRAASACSFKGDWAFVERLATEMAAKQVDSPWGAYFLGVASLERGEVLRAHWMFDLAERKAGGPMTLVRYEKARLLEKEEGPAEAAREMKLVAKLDPTLIPAQLWLAQVHHRDRMSSDAERYYRAVLAQKPDHGIALAGLGDVMMEQGKGREAVEFLVRAIDARPDRLDSRVKLARVYETLTKEPAKAIQALRDLRSAVERKGRSKSDEVGFDIAAKIKSLEQSMKPMTTKAEATRAREPAKEKSKGGGK